MVNEELRAGNPLSTTERVAEDVRDEELQCTMWNVEVDRGAGQEARIRLLKSQASCCKVRKWPFPPRKRNPAGCLVYIEDFRTLLSS
jgi:hypothetical protein